VIRGFADSTVPEAELDAARDRLDRCIVQLAVLVRVTDGWVGGVELVAADAAGERVQVDAGCEQTARIRPFICRWRWRRHIG